MSKSKKCINCGRFLVCEFANEELTKDNYCDRYIKADREIRRIKDGKNKSCRYSTYARWFCIYA